jgi:hypothetical protein
MRKITAIICVIFALVMVLALPVGAASPYQTYTYSIDGKALYSPDAYTPDKTVDAAAMGLLDISFIGQFYPELLTYYDEMVAAEDAQTKAEVAFNLKFKDYVIPEEPSAEDEEYNAYLQAKKLVEEATKTAKSAKKLFATVKKWVTIGWNDCLYHLRRSGGGHGRLEQVFQQNKAGKGARPENDGDRSGRGHAAGDGRPGGAASFDERTEKQNGRSAAAGGLAGGRKHRPGRGHRAGGVHPGNRGDRGKGTGSGTAGRCVL